MGKFDDSLKRIMENMTGSFFSGGATAGNVEGDMRSGDFYAPKDARIPKALGVKKAGKKRGKIPLIKRNLVNESPYENEQVLVYDKDHKHGNRWDVESMSKKPRTEIDVRDFGKCSLIQDTENKRIHDYWITPDNMLSASFVFDVDENGLYSVSVWNDRTHKGISRVLFFDYYLKKFDFIVSSKSNTAAGIAYWKKLIMTATDKNYKTTIIFENEEYPIDYGSVDYLWGKHVDHSNTRIKIYKK